MTLEALHPHRAFPKIARLERDVIITEKIDGTNAHVLIVDILDSVFDKEAAPYEELVDKGWLTVIDVPAKNGHERRHRYIGAGSRNRWLKPGDDNFGFAKWVFECAPMLAQLGPGDHFGEWWGQGVQRGYGLPLGDRRFSLFNVSRFGDNPLRDSVVGCCSTVPLLYQGPIKMQSGELASDYAKRRLLFAGSQAAPGFKNPEGIVVFHTHGNDLKKWTSGPEEQGGKG